MRTEQPAEEAADGGPESAGLHARLRVCFHMSGAARGRGCTANGWSRGTAPAEVDGETAGGARARDARVGTQIGARLRSGRLLRLLGRRLRDDSRAAAPAAIAAASAADQDQIRQVHFLE